MEETAEIKSVAIIGAGAAGAAAAAAFAAEDYFDRIRVFERRETAGGHASYQRPSVTWDRIFDPDPYPLITPRPGELPPQTDPPLEIPNDLPRTTPSTSQERYDKTPIYADLTTNVPAIAMSFSDIPFAYGPFVPHWVPKQYIENYFSAHQTDSLLVLNTTVEDVSKSSAGQHRWSLTLRQHDSVARQDRWWREEFDAVIIANGHYSVPFVPHVNGLNEYIQTFPGRVFHSKTFRSARIFSQKKVLVIGNSASGHDVITGLLQTAELPVYQSRRSRSRWDGDHPPRGVEWKPIVKEYLPSGDIIFDDGSVVSDIDAVIYCTGYKASFPFWNTHANGAPLWDYTQDRLVGNHLHTFLTDFPTVGVVGVPRTLTFRSFEYQAIALARVFARRNAIPLPSKEQQHLWEKERGDLVSREKRRFHDIPWDNGETISYLQELFQIAGLPRIEGQGRYPPVLGERTRWAIEHVRKYPLPGKDRDEDGWTVISAGSCRDSLHFL
ncbi:dimethylaniline monooxygenase [Diplogelasinospora grovesii]|uniref:Dimethylaniline monooxygenase n=1 Tax=Diplogelasinospora grovesii TaxID=303347 RepID=A0AAN6N362_9PEZI|nr:dimethylaniline monooxygenase [Diplogelasinospora grovesii]